MKVHTISKSSRYHVGATRQYGVRVHLGFRAHDKAWLYAVRGGELQERIKPTSPIGRAALRALALHLWGR